MNSALNLPVNDVNISLNTIQLWLANYIWPYVRISTMLMVMSVTGARFIPIRVRLYLSLAITFVIVLAVEIAPISIKLMSFKGFMLIAEQILIGVAMGMVTQFVLQAFALLGQILGMQSSLGFASMVDPNNGQGVPLLGQLFMFLATLFFLATDHHLKMIQMIALSFKTLPIGSGSLNSLDFRQMASWFGIMFQAGLGMSISGIVALLTINLSFGVMTRAAPQLNIFSLGFTFALLMGLLLCWYIIAGLYGQYEMIWRIGQEQICSLINIDC